MCKQGTVPLAPTAALEEGRGLKTLTHPLPMLCCSRTCSGIISTFYLSSLEGSDPKDEIDFEFVANEKYYVQTNYFANG